MAVLIFRSEADERYFGFSRQRDGGNLPSNLEPWRWVPETAIEGGLARLGPVEVIEAEVEANGCCVMRASEVSVMRQDIPPEQIKH